MEKVKNTVGGFVGINEGNISNCYSTLKINTKKRIGEFCYRNQGNITQSFSNNSIKKANKVKEFCIKNRGNIEKYFYIENEKLTTSSKERNELESKWDLENIWNTKKENDLKTLTFRNETFLEQLPVKNNSVEISNADQLYLFAKRVNRGYDSYRNANVILTKNIDLKGKKWIPIGTEKYNSFKGTFNGNGHTIENFKINQDKLEYVGFFGYVEGATICNLNIDCVCKGKRTIGALVGINDKGRIASCKVIASIQYGEVTGGLVGKNTGEIIKCCVMGKLGTPVVLLPLIRNLLVIGVIIIIVSILINKYYKDKVFIPVAIDPNVIIDSSDDDEFKGTTTDNKASFDFAQTIVIDSSTMVGTLDFRNPKRGNHNIVIKLQISDKELKEKLGATGRSKEEQEKIEKEEGYNEENYMTEIYHSGLIERGYKLPKIQISELKDGTKLKIGTYNAVVSLEFYKSGTNEKAIVNTKLPVTLVIK